MKPLNDGTVEAKKLADEIYKISQKASSPEVALTALSISLVSIWVQQSQDGGDDVEPLIVGLRNIHRGVKPHSHDGKIH